MEDFEISLEKIIMVIGFISFVFDVIFIERLARKIYEEEKRNV